MFFDRSRADVRGIADPDMTLHEAFSVARGGLREMFGIRSWIAGLRAVTQGHFIGRKLGDPWTLPTIVAIRDHTVIWEYSGDHAGDHPDLDVIAQTLAAR